MQVHVADPVPGEKRGMGANALEIGFAEQAGTSNT